MAIEYLQLEQARSRIAAVWFIGTGILFLILVAQSLGTVYKGHLSRVWSAFFPMVVPTLSLVVSVLGAEAIDATRGRARNNVVVRASFFKITLLLSVVYLALILVSIIGQPAFAFFHDTQDTSADVALDALQPAGESNTVVNDGEFEATNLLQVSNLWLAPVQGLVVAAIGVLFFTKQSESQ